MRLTLNCLAKAVILLFGATAAHAQSSLTFRGSSLDAIPLDVNQPLTVGDDGSVQATCLFQQGTTVCQGVSPPVSQQIPTVALSVPSLTPDAQNRYTVSAGQQVSISRVITNTADVCIATTTPAAGASGWSSVFSPPATSSSNVQFASAGEVTIGLRCYNQAGAPANATQLQFIVEAAAGPNPDLCELPADPLIRPAGFSRYVLDWNQMFQSGPFPNAPGYLNPAGSWTINRSLPGVSAAGMYITIPITPEPDRTYIFNHSTAQFVGAAGYFGGPDRAGKAFISISPCAGDVRPRNSSSPDPLLSVCRSGMLTVDGATWRFSTKSTTGSSVCRVNAGETYWLNFMMIDPTKIQNAGTGTINLTTQECNQGDRCEALYQITRQ